MADTQFSAETEVLVEKAKKYDDAANELRDRMNALMNSLTPLESTWVGQGGMSFQQVRARYNEDVAKLHNSLSTVAAKVAEASSGYVTSDTESSDSVSRAGADAGSISSKLIL